MEEREGGTAVLYSCDHLNIHKHTLNISCKPVSLTIYHSDLENRENITHC